VIGRIRYPLLNRADRPAKVLAMYPPQLIADSAVTVQEVAHAVGYKDRRSLERALKLLRNMTPGALRSWNSEASVQPTDAAPSPPREHS